MDHEQDETEEKAWGGAREGAGRPKGRPSLKRAAQAVLEVEEKFPGWSPVLHLAAVANDETLDVMIRLDAAKAAAPYLHSRPKPVELDPDGLVELERRLLFAKVEAAAEALESPGLAERLRRAKERASITIMMSTGIDRAPDDPIIDITPAQPPQEARDGAAPPSAGPAPAETPVTPPAPLRPILPRDTPPASADWSAPSLPPLPERQAFAELPPENPFDAQPWTGGLAGSRT